MELETLPPSSTTTTERRSSATCLVRGLTFTVLSIFLTLMAVISIAWLVLKPLEPGFRVSSLSVSNFNVSDSQLRGKFGIELTLRNPNKKIQVAIDRFNVLVFYGAVELSGAAVQRPIYLEKMSEKNLKVDLVFTRGSTKLAHKVVSEDLVKDWNKGVVNFNVKMLLIARFQYGILPTREKFLAVFCDDLDVEFYSTKGTGKLLGIGKDCHV